MDCDTPKNVREGGFLEQVSCEQLSLVDTGSATGHSTASKNNNIEISARPELHMVGNAEGAGFVKDRITGVGYQDDKKVKSSVERLAHRYGYRFAKRAFD
jgi:hypothetical protein